MSRRTVSMLICSAAFSITLTATARGYRAAGNYAVGNHPVALAVGDLNADGKLDLAVANLGSKSVSVLLGRGDGTFAAGKEFETDVEPSALVIADLDGDGQSDLVVSNKDASMLTVLYGYGDGAFGPPVIFRAGDAPASVLASLRSQTTTRTGSGFASAAIGDFNGDGELDQAVTLSGSNRVSVLLGSENAVPAGHNRLINPGFDLGTFAPWKVGENFCSSPCQPWKLSHSMPQAGNGDAADVGNIEVVQTFTAVPTSRITQVSIWVRHPAGAQPTAIDFLYTDGTDQEYVVFTADSNWDYFDVTSDLAAGKKLNELGVWGYSTSSGVTPSTFLDTTAIGGQ